MSYLYDDREKGKLEIPPLDIFIKNEYKQYKIPDLSIQRLHDIVMLNSVISTQGLQIINTLFGFKSFFNHHRDSNVKIEPISSNQIFMFVSEDIKEG